MSTMSTALSESIRSAIKTPSKFFCSVGSISLRTYQRAAADAIIDSVLNQRGFSFVVMFPRQSGKNELQAQIETYLLARLSTTPAEMVKISPTFKPQTENAMRRLERSLKSNFLTRTLWSKRQGYIYAIDSACIYFFSGEPTANIVGATASTLLSIDEAQDIDIPKYDKDIAPMAASTNATRVFWGTAWTGSTLLARELRAARDLQAVDGIERVFVTDADAVAAEVPAYGDFVAEQVRRLGRNNPMVKTQFYCEEIDAEGGLFPPSRTALMRGDHAPIQEPRPGYQYAFLIDVAGEDEAHTDNIAAAALSNPGRDATALTVVEIDTSTLGDPLINAPTYRTVDRHLWLGARHTAIYAAVRSMAENWQPAHIVIDATGVGAGLSSFLGKTFPGRVFPFIFNSATKSKLGWDFLAVIDTGRWKEWSSTHADDLLFQFWVELAAVQYEIIPGPNKTMRWGVPNHTKNPDTGQPIHDDLVISAALIAVLDTEIEWFAASETTVIHASDVIMELDQGF